MAEGGGVRVNDEIWDLVTLRKPTGGVLATADRKGRVNAAVIGSLQFSDRETMTMLIGDNRTLANLKRNPRACFLVAAGEGTEDVRGCKLYLEVDDMVESGPVIDKGREMVAEASGIDSGKAVKAFVTLRVVDVRPLVEVGGAGM